MLKRADELIQESHARSNSAAHSAGLADVPGAAAQSFAGCSFSYTSTAGAEFLRKLEAYREFSINLVLVGEPGTHFQHICEAFIGVSNSGSERLVWLRPTDFDLEPLLTRLLAFEDEPVDKISLIMRDVTEISGDRKSILFRLSRREAPFNRLPVEVRFLYCLEETPESLYDRGAIDEDLFVFIGSLEIRVPSLRECREDIPAFARYILEESKVGGSEVEAPVLAEDSSEFIASYEWPGNYEELKRTLLAAVDSSTGPEITLNDISRHLKVGESDHA